MAVSLIATVQNYQGLSTDDKPTAVLEGSTFHCVDTGDQFVYYQDGWTLDFRMAAAVKLATLL